MTKVIRLAVLSIVAVALTFSCLQTSARADGCSQSQWNVCNSFCNYYLGTGCASCTPGMNQSCNGGGSQICGTCSRHVADGCGCDMGCDPCGD